VLPVSNLNLLETDGFGLFENFLVLSKS